MNPPVLQIGYEFQVGTAIVTGTPGVSHLSNGNFVVAWADPDVGGGLSGQIFTADGSTVGSKFLVTGTYDNRPSVTGLSNGGFVVTWSDFNRSDSGYEIDVRAQLFAADGSKVGTDFLVNTQTSGDQTQSTVTALANGGFVAAWSVRNDPGISGWSLKAQVFAADGSKIGPEFPVSAPAASLPHTPTITDLGSGFMVSWAEFASGTQQAIKAQMFAADGSIAGTGLTVAASQWTSTPTITSLGNGGFVVSWVEQDDTHPIWAKAQVFAADGSKVGPEILLNQALESVQAFFPTVTRLNNGAFVIAWEEDGRSSGTGGHVKAQVFTPGGIKIGSEFLIDSPQDISSAPRITAVGNSGFVATWINSNGGVAGATGQVTAQIYEWDAAPSPSIDNAAVHGGYVNAIGNTDAQTLSGRAEPGTTINVYVNGATTPSYIETVDEYGNWAVTIGKLADGQYSYVAYVINSGGYNAGVSSLDFTVDATPPVLQITAITAEDGATFTVSGADPGSAGLVINLSSTTGWSGSATADSSGVWHITGVPPDVLGHNLTLSSVDAAGNRGANQYVLESTVRDIVAAGGVQNVFGSATDVAVHFGGRQNVYPNGNTTGTRLYAGATQFDWGTDTNAVIEGGTQYVVGSSDSVGSAISTTINSGTQYVLLWGYATFTTVNPDGQQVIHQGGLAEHSVIAGGSQFVFGTSFSALVEKGGLQAVYDFAFETNVRDGVQQVYAGGLVRETTLGVDGRQIVWGTAETTHVDGGTQYIWGSADQTSVSAGLQLIGDGGQATNTSVAGGEQRISAGALATSTTVTGGGIQSVYGKAELTDLNAGGWQYVHGTVNATNVNDGGGQSIYLDGAAFGTAIYAGGVQIDWGSAYNTTVVGGTQFVWGTAANTEVVSGTQFVGAGGVAEHTILSGGTAHVVAGGATHDVEFGRGGRLELEQASAFSGTISGWQARDVIDFGDIAFGDTTTLTYVENADNGGGSLTVTSGATTTTLALLGQYSAADFALSSDGHGGTLLSNPAVEPQVQAVLAPALAA